MGKLRWTTFDAQPSSDGSVRVGVWDRVCVPGSDSKDGQDTEFTLETLSQMADNFLDRNGDPIPLDYNHQSNYASQNGQPAPALAFYGAFAVVWDGKVVKLAIGSDTPPCPGSLYVSPSTATADGIDVSRDGLWCFRNEVTELGQQLLRGFKLVSPTFMSDGTRRDGTPVGYCLAAVAATNTPWQSATAISFEQPKDSAGAVPAPTEKESSMSKFAKYAKFAGAADGADDSAIKQAIGAKMAGLAQKAMSEDDFDLGEAAKEMDEAASLMEGDSEMAAECKMARLMSARFSKMAKFESDADADDDEKKKMAAMAADEEKQKMAKLEADKDADGKAAMAVMQASLSATNEKLAKFEAAEQKRADAEKKELEAKFSRLADQAIAGGYDKAQRDNLITFARSNFDAAHAAVVHLLPKTNAPAHLFDRASRNGGPIGGDTNAREDAGSIRPRVVTNALGRFVEVDGAFASEIEKTADSKDPTTMAKVDKLLPAPQRAIKFHRLLAARKVVAAERPDLADAAEAAE